MKKIRSLIFLLAFFFTLTGVINVSAYTFNTSDISKSTYIIGKTMYTREVVDNYKGALTTEYIMLASKTIDSNNVDDMIIYYKNVDGEWINAISDTKINNMAETVEINYKNGKNYYTVTFDYGDSNVKKEGYQESEKVKKPTNPTKEGYTFYEWQLNGETFDFDDYELTNDITLNAVWLDNNDTSLKNKILLSTKRETATCTNLTVVEDGATYLSGTNDCINFNYVWYSGKLWRITAINSDGTMKMITDDLITTIYYGSDVNFYDISKKDDSTYTGSYIYQWLNEDFLDTLYNYQNIIVEDSTWNISNSNASSTDNLNIKLSSTTLVNNSTIGKDTPVGLLNSYEYYLSYKNTSSYSNGYLNIGYSWWLLNPYNTSNVWTFYESDDEVDLVNLGYFNPTGYSYGVRPSINLKATIKILSGSGTKENPYKIEGDKEETTINTTKLNTRTIGEYVIFDEDGDNSTKEIYRIVEIDNEGFVKLNKNDYIKNGTTTVLKAFSTSEVFGTDSSNSDDYWDYYLNKTWYNNLNSTSKNMISEGKYYIKSMKSYSYKSSLCDEDNTTETTNKCTKTTNTWSGYVGLPRYGEMFASQQDIGHDNSTDMWFMTPNSASGVWNADKFNIGTLNGSDSKFKNAVRPSIYLKSNIVITGGDGTKSNPFTINLISE